MKHPVTYKALKIFSWLFFITALLIAVFGVGMSIFTFFGPVKEPGIELASQRLGAIMYLMIGLLYPPGLIFIGVASRALSHILGEIK